MGGFATPYPRRLPGPGRSATCGEGTRGFTLVEVPIAMAITALVAVMAYSGLSAAAGCRESSRRGIAPHNVSRLWVYSRDLRQVVNRPVVDEFGQLSPAPSGGELARTMLIVTRAGCTTQRVRVQCIATRSGGWRMALYGAATFPFSIVHPVLRR